MAMGGRPGPGGELPFHTVGHSNRSLGDFIDLLRESRVGRVVDIRITPEQKNLQRWYDAVSGRPSAKA